MDRDPRYAGGRIWGAIATALLVVVLAIMGLTAFTLYMLGVIL
jgi:hypothetical protein